MNLYPLFDFEKHRIVMATTVSFKGQLYAYFPEGIPYYHLYRTKRKINSFAELEYIAEKFIYLNPDFELETMKGLFYKLSERESGHVIRTYTQRRVEAMIEIVHERKKVPYTGKLRKIIFNPSKMLTKEQKMRIVGQVIGSKPNVEEEDIFYVMDELHLNKEIITIAKIAEMCDSSRYMIKKSLTPKVVKEMDRLNTRLRTELNVVEVLEAIEVMRDKKVKIRIRSIKEYTSVREYKALRKALHHYRRIL